MKKLIILLLSLSFWQLIIAQLENIPLVTVTGEATIKAKPDYAILALKVYKTIKPEESIRYLEIFKDEDTKIRIFAFDENDIEVSFVQKEGSTYVKEVFITVNDMEKLDKVLLELNKLRFTQFHFFEYRLKNLPIYKNKARLQAIKFAKVKASAMAESLGQKIGKAHTIEEIDYENYNWYNTKNRIWYLSERLDADDYMIFPGYISITSKVKIGFDLVK